MSSRYIYGLDIAWRTGIAIYDLETHQFVYVGNIDANEIKLTAKEKRNHILEHGKRLRFTSTQMQKIIEQYPPSIVLIERYFNHFNKSTIAIAKIHGIINELFAEIPTIYYPPKTIKEAILSGDSKKDEIRKVIESKFPYITFTCDDESDAVATAITYLIKNNWIAWEKQETPKKKTRKKKSK